MKFFKNVYQEMKKVKWPDRKYMVKYSIATLSVIIFFSLYFFVIELIMSALKVGVR